MSILNTINYLLNDVMELSVVVENPNTEDPGKSFEKNDSATKKISSNVEVLQINFSYLEPTILAYPVDLTRRRFTELTDSAAFEVDFVSHLS